MWQRLATTMRFDCSFSRRDSSCLDTDISCPCDRVCHLLSFSPFLFYVSLTLIHSLAVCVTPLLSPPLSLCSVVFFLWSVVCVSQRAWGSNSSEWRKHDAAKRMDSLVPPAVEGRECRWVRHERVDSASSAPVHLLHTVGQHHCGHLPIFWDYTPQTQE